ncbi:DUF6928 family protein [Kitasatospora sp. NPDC052896]|uniref:DUF6928 family protein n=1 Tax=Kitasatospora sp. NPDC052896 TaxID=3364061 RepID=UPI0037C9DF54
MGAKTGLLVYMDAASSGPLRLPAEADPERTAELVGRLYPGWEVTESAGCELGDATYPPDGTAYLGSFPKVDIVCDRHWMGDYPSRLPQHLIDASAGCRLVVHWMHSVVDFLAFAVWEDEQLVRSLSLSPDRGVVEDLGERFAFEAPFWAGEHPVELDEAWGEQDPYPLPFHPLELGEEALRAFFGFVLEGMPEPDDIDPYEVALRGFHLTVPGGPTPAEKEAVLRAAVSRMGPPRMLTYGPDGTLIVVDRR